MLFLQTLLSQHYDKHPILILKDVTYHELKAMVDYMYRGEVNISQDKLGAFLSAAKSLQIKGLSDNAEDTIDEELKRHEKQPLKAPPITPPPHSRASLPQKTVEPKRTSSQVDYQSNSSVSCTTSPPNSGKRRHIAQRKTSEASLPFPSNHVTNSFDTLKEFQPAPLVTKIVPNSPIASSCNITMPSPIVPKITMPRSLVPSLDLHTSLTAIDTSTSVLPELGLLQIKAEPITDSLVIPKTEYSYDNNEGSIEDLTLDDDEDEFDKSQAGPSHEDESNHSE